MKKVDRPAETERLDFLSFIAPTPKLACAEKRTSGPAPLDRETSARPVHEKGASGPQPKKAPHEEEERTEAGGKRSLRGLPAQRSGLWLLDWDTSVRPVHDQRASRSQRKKGTTKGGGHEALKRAV